jgi:hypothetical protein
METAVICSSTSLAVRVFSWDWVSIVFIDANGTLALETKGGTIMPIQVCLIPLTGEGAGVPLTFAVINYQSPKLVNRAKCLVKSVKAQSLKKKYLALEYTDVETAQTAIEAYLQTLRARKPDLREFDITYPTV